MEGFADAIAEELRRYNERLEEDIRRAIDETARHTDEEIQKHIIFRQRTGKYKKAFRMKKTQSLHSYKKTWYVAAPYSSLTHLLEYGHALAQGGRARAYPHIRYGEEFARAKLPLRIKEAVERA